MSNHEERITDMPGPLRWFLVAFKQVGFPVIICVYLGYMLFIEGEKNRNSQNELKEVMSALKKSVDQQTRILRHKSTDD